MQSNIVINLQIEGVHQWMGCPIEEVSFLRQPHRHLFYITCKKEVSHLDRDIEIIQLKRRITKYLLENFAGDGPLKLTCNFGNMSCEQIALELAKDFKLNYCQVLEDGENGAEIIM